MEKPVFLAIATLEVGIEVVVLAPSCWLCSLWREVTRGTIDTVEIRRSFADIIIDGVAYRVMDDAVGYGVVYSSEAYQWLDLWKSIYCTH